MLFSRVLPTSEDVLFDLSRVDVSFFESEFELFELELGDSVDFGSAELESFESFEINEFESLLTLFSVERDFP